MSETITGVPDWEDTYLDRVSDRLMHSYDLSKDETVGGERFDLVGHLEVENRKQFFHPALSYAEHDAREHVFARRVDAVSIPDLERLLDVGHDLAAEWIDADEQHYETAFTFVLVAPEIPADVREFVTDHGGRTLLKYGYFGRYEVNLVVVAPDDRETVASRHADVAAAFSLWEDVTPDRKKGLLERVVGRFR